MKRLVMLDRDGTINVARHYLSSPEQVELIHGAVEGIRLMRLLGLTVVVLTNQSGIARGYLTPDTLRDIHHRLHELLSGRGVSLNAIYTCPHHPADGCDCRKPAPGLARKAANEFKADLSRSFIVGDDICDIELGKQVKATTILVRTGYGARAAEDGTAQPDYVVENLWEAAQVIKRLVASPHTYPRAMPKL